jgi:hypothetical protein
MKGPPPSWSRRNCDFDHLVGAAIGQGYGKILRYTGIETLQRAHEIRRGIFRCAQHRGIAADAGPSDRLVTGSKEMGVHKAGPDYELWYRVWSKQQARKRHLERYGSDRQNWPYNPRRPQNQAEKDAYAVRDETGRPVTSR